mgnify:CR=1 FL=1
MNWQYNRPLSQEELDVLAVIESDPRFGLDQMDKCLLQDGPHLQAEGITGGVGDGWDEVSAGCPAGTEVDAPRTTDRGDA